MWDSYKNNAPFFAGLPLDEVAQSSHVAMLVTARGGHIGFLEGMFSPLKLRNSYYSERVIEQYLEALYKTDIRRDLF